MTERINKWAITEPVNCATVAQITDLDTIKAAATNDDDLLMRALADAIEALGRYALVGRSLADAMRLLDQIREEFEKKADRP